MQNFTKTYSLQKISDYTCFSKCNCIVLCICNSFQLYFLIGCMIVVIYSFSILRGCFKFCFFTYFPPGWQFLLTPLMPFSPLPPSMPPQHIPHLFLFRKGQVSYEFQARKSYQLSDGNIRDWVWYWMEWESNESHGWKGGHFGVIQKPNERETPTCYKDDPN